MKRFVCLMIMMMSISTVSALACTTVDLTGNWLGSIEVSSVKLRLVLKITGARDHYIASLDSIDQGAKDLTIDLITQHGSTVSFSSVKYRMSYEGVLNEACDEISGNLKNPTGSLPLNLKRILGEVSTRRSQDPVRPYPYEEYEVAYKNDEDNVKLAGTLTVPHGAGKYPAVLLITGSGSQDRNETMVGHHPFLVLADYLTRRGIAVLRVDDRGVGGSDAGPPTANSADYVRDVLAGIRYLKKRPEIDPHHIGLLGHSEGGMIAPAAAVASRDISFIIMLAGPGVPGDEVVLKQIALINKASGEDPVKTAAALDLQKSVFSIIMAEPDNGKARVRIDGLLASLSDAMSPSERMAFAPIEQNFKAQTPVLLSPWYRYFLSYDPRATLKRVAIPVLALNGDNDLQVEPKENLTSIAKALAIAHNKDVTVKSFPGLNHLFQTSATGLPREYGDIEETIAPIVLETIAAWITKRTMHSN